MEAVKAFNNELSSLYESKPPVSRAKMARITKSAIKAVKFYKHVVQSVEKFILKCRSEYKVPGLYVIDSIVRQSRHQFGVDKDVFAQRFSKNIVSTFQNLCSCPKEEKNKIVRVLHLWQKNCVFPPDIIQQLLNLAEQGNCGTTTGALSTEEPFGDNQNSPHSEASLGADVPSYTAPNDRMNTAISIEGMNPEVSMTGHLADEDDNTSAASQQQHGSSDGSGVNVQTNILNTMVQLLQSQQPITQLLQQQLLQQLPQQLLQPGSLPHQLLQQLPSASHQQQHQYPPSSSSTLLSSVPLPPSSASQLPSAQIQPTDAASGQLQQQSEQGYLQTESLRGVVSSYDRRSEENSQGSEPIFNKSLLEFDYGESDDEDNRQGGRSSQAKEDLRPSLQTANQTAFPNHQFNAKMLDNSGPAPYYATNIMQNMVGYQQQQQQLIQPQLHQQQLHQQPPELLQTQQFSQHHSHQQLNASRLLPQVDEPAERHEYFHGKLPSYQNENDDNYEQTYEENFGSQQNTWSEQDVSMYDNEEQAVDQRYRQDFDEDNQFRDRNRFRDHEERKRRRSRERDRSSPRRRGQSRNDRDASRRSRSRDKRRRSRSHDRGRPSRSRSQERMRERERRERERDRRNRGLPPIEENHISVCSTTLWIGHLNKHTKENELKEEMSKYGEITSFNLIPPRGCAYVSFTTRKDASRALDKMKGSKLQGNVLKVAWAMGVGMKESEFKDLWDVELGVSYIPWNRIPENLDDLSEGGFLDDDSLPEPVKVARKEKTKEKEKPVAGISQPEFETVLRSANSVSQGQTSAESSPPSFPPPMPVAALPSNIITPLMQPPPGFVPPMMVPGAMPPMLRMPPPMMHGMMPPIGTPGTPLLPPPRPGLPPSTAPSEATAVSKLETAAEQRLNSGSTCSASESLAPPVPPGMGLGWQLPPNMRPGVMPFRPPMPPFIQPGAFGRMPFLPPPPRFQGSTEGKDGLEKAEHETAKEPVPEPVAKKEESEELEEAEPNFPPLPAAPPPLRPWAPGGSPAGGPRPDFMGPRLRPPFGPRGFPGLIPLPSGGRMGRGDGEVLENEEVGEHSREMEMEEETGDDEPIFQGPDSHGFHPNFGGPMRGGRPPWFDFRGGPRGPPGPRGMRIPGHPRFPFEDPGRGIGRPAFRMRGPPPGLMDDPRFNGPRMGFRGRLPFPPRGTGMPNFRGPAMEPPFNRLPFGVRGPRPRFPRLPGDFGYAGATEDSGYYDENPEGEQEGRDMGERWNEGEENVEEEEWMKEAGEGDETRRPMGRRQGHWRDEGRRGENELEEIVRKGWRGPDRRPGDDEMESDGRRGHWGSGHHRDDRGGRSHWGSQGRRHSREEGEEERGWGWQQRRPEDGRDSWGNHDQDSRRNNGKDEEPNTKSGGNWGGEETRRSKSEAGECSDDNTKAVVGLDAVKEVEPPALEKAEKKPRKTRWSSVEPASQSALEDQEPDTTLAPASAQITPCVGEVESLATDTTVADE